MGTEQEITKQKEYIEKVREINKGKDLKYYILTMGCQLNENDSEWDTNQQKNMKKRI